MKKIIFVFTCLLFSSSVFAQTSNEFYQMAVQKMKQEQYLDANVLIDKAIEKDKTDVENYLLKAEIEFRQKNAKGVFLNTFLAIKVAPNQSYPYNMAGNYYNSYGYTDSALVMFNRALARAETDTIRHSYLINRAVVYMTNQQFKLAKKDLEEALKFNPVNQAALNNMAVTLAGLKETRDAIVYLERLAKLDSLNAGTFVNLGLYHTELGNYPAAKTNFDYALQLAPNEPLLYSNRGHLFYKMGDYTAAIKDLNRSIKDYPSNAFAYRNRALVYLALQKNTEACRDLEAALHYRFTQMYGNEVEKLAKKNCR